MLPFELALISRGFAELSRDAASLGFQAAERAASALGQLLGCEVQISGRALPGCSADGTGCARVVFDLPALPGTAVVEIDAGLVARAVDRLACGTGEPPGATALTPIETSVLELMALVSLDALSRLAPIERWFSPRLARVGTSPILSPLCIALELTLGDERGRGRLLLPPTAVRALRARPELSEAMARAEVACSVRQGCATVSPAELAALCPGDVLLLDPAPADLLVLPGGHRIRGRIAGNLFQVEEVS
jgi:type III secretion protein Q